MASLEASETTFAGDEHMIIGAHLAAYPPFDGDETDLPIDITDILGILDPSVTPTNSPHRLRLEQEARRAELVLKYMRHVADYGVTIDLPNGGKAREFLAYLDDCTSTRKQVKWWIKNVFVSGAPDRIDTHGNELHLRALTGDTQLHGWVRAA